MARALWSGSISFGLIYIPVRLYPAVKHREVSFHNVHDKDGRRIKEKRVCSYDGQEVAYKNVAKGYQLSKRKLVMVSQEEIDAADPEASRTLSIRDFVDLSEIDPMFYLSTYYLVPEADARKSYSLLREAMEATGKVAIATFVMRGRQYLATLRPVAGAMVLSTMLYADELVPLKSVPGLARGAAPSVRERKLAKSLVNKLSVGFKPSKYKDTHRAKLLALIKRKARGHKIALKPVPALRRTHVERLLKQLEESVNAKARR